MQTLRKLREFSMNAFNILVSTFGPKISSYTLLHFKWVILVFFLPFQKLKEVLSVIAITRSPHPLMLMFNI